MAQIKDVKLQIQPKSTDLKKVIVDFKLTFTTAEVGKTFRYDINLLGEDKLGDEGPIVIGGQLISDFSFGVFGIPSKLITATATEQSFTEIRNISTQKLNEDPGFDSINVSPPELPPQIIKVPHKDEIYAEVSLKLSFKDKQNNEMTLFLGKKRSATVTGSF